MPLYEFVSGSLAEVPGTTYAALGLREREDVQRALRENIKIISPDTLILAEEFGNWEDSRRRIDLLGLDSNGCLVVVELKRTEDGGHMELQALRYAAMISTMKFEQAVDAHRTYLLSQGLPADTAEKRIRDFLDIPEGPVAFSNQVRIVLASADFSKEVTSAVLWLNAQGLEITCFRMRPYSFRGGVLMDVQQVIPLPEAAAFQVAIREKTMELAAAEASGRDFTRYRVQTSIGEFTNLPKRRFIYHVVREAVRLGVTLDDIRDAVPWKRSNLFASAPGELSGVQVMAASPGKSSRRYFCEDDEVIHVNGHSYLLTNQWGIRTEEAVDNIVKLLPQDHGLVYEALS